MIPLFEALHATIAQWRQGQNGMLVAWVPVEEGGVAIYARLDHPLAANHHQVILALSHQAPSKSFFQIECSI